MHTIKLNKGSNPEIKEFLSRKYKFKALWKTYFEFDNAYFANVNSQDRMNLQLKIQAGALSKKYGANNLLCLPAKPKLKGINENDFFIDIDSNLIDASKATNQHSENLSYFIVYVSEKIISKKTEIIKSILDLQS